MVYDRVWWGHDLYALTLGGGGFMNNPGRYLALTAADQRSYRRDRYPPTSPRTRDRSSSSGTRRLNFQYMPKDWITWWTETISATRTFPTGLVPAV